MCIGWIFNGIGVVSRVLDVFSYGGFEDSILNYRYFILVFVIGLGELYDLF